MSDEWVVIGGKGKPRKPRSAAAAAGGQPPPAGTAAGGPAVTPAVVVPPLPPPPPPPAALPGWGGGGVDAGCSAGEWRGVGGGRRRARAARTPEERTQELAAAVEECRREVAATPMFGHLRAAMAAAEVQCSAVEGGGGGGGGGWSWGRVRQMVVYGLGCIEDSRVSRYQLALALLLRDLLPGLAAPPQLFDPAFSEADAALIARLGLALIPENEGGARSAAEPTLFYLPHCEAALCDTLLGANWSAAALPNVAILGNSFSTYRERWAAPGAKPGGTRPGRLLRLAEAGAVLELPVPDGAFHVASAFNDSSLHVFPPPACAKMAWGE
ncbi:MAG: hypothetical protein J3K34DRAFT_458516 [Monoraphidium minutum]|nr:MAG: hypothetical protein J3K34DRAFT_458516 [Monoraphidium minutum]